MRFLAILIFLLLSITSLGFSFEEDEIKIWQLIAKKNYTEARNEIDLQMCDSPSLEKALHLSLIRVFIHAKNLNYWAAESEIRKIDEFVHWEFMQNTKYIPEL